MNTSAKSIGGVASQPVQLAVLDFDGTCISTDSPAYLVHHLTNEGKLSIGAVFAICWWGLRYKFQLPQNESHAREIVFTAFAGQPAEEVDAYLHRFYDECLDRRFRAQADEEIEKLLAQGCDVIIVSATFEPILLRCMESHAFQHQISTRMEVTPDGLYTNRVVGLPVEGEEKVAALKRYADAAYGEGNWELAYAYGDHHSDIPILSAARQAFAVTPDRPLKRAAKARGWTILNWKNESANKNRA